MIKLLDILKEIKVNNPNITPEKVKEFIIKNKLGIGFKDDEYFNLVDGMFPESEFDSYDEEPLDFIDDLSKNNLEKFYNKLQDLIK